MPSTREGPSLLLIEVFFLATIISTIEEHLLINDAVIQLAFQLEQMLSSASSWAAPGIQAASSRITAAAGRELLRSLAAARSPHRGASLLRARLWLIF